MYLSRLSSNSDAGEPGGAAVRSTRLLRRLPLPARRARTVARSVTIVTSISYAGTLQQSATGKNSRANIVWERSMHFKHQLPGATTRRRPSRVLRPRLRSHLKVVHRTELDDQLKTRRNRIQISSKPDASWYSILAGRFRTVMMEIGGLAARGEATFERILLAGLSWTIAQVLAGCAQYAEAMYPCFTEPVEADDGHAAAGWPSEVTASPEEESRARAAVALVQAETRARSEAKRSISGRWSASIRSPVAEFWLMLRHGRKRAIMAPPALDQRTTGDAEVSRHRTEYSARFGDHCE
jgi:hypothetical protein